MSKNITYEIIWLRFISCLSVVLIHAISSGVNQFNFNSPVWEEVLLLIQLLIIFATPSFVFMSEFILSKYYPNGLPQQFFKKRIKYLLFPYFSMALIYAIVFSDNFDLLNIAFITVTNAFLGNFTAYFILIIFQFYILHYIFWIKMKKSKTLLVILTSLLVNILYLSFFYLTESPIDNPLVNYFWAKGHWMLFPAWVFYFVLGYYIGGNYEKVLNTLDKYRIIIYLAPIFTFLLLVLNTDQGFSITSKRVDMILHTTAIVFFVLLVTSKTSSPPKVVLFISKYSFGIYLLHKLVVNTLGPISDNILIHVISLFLIGIIFSITTVFIMNKIPFGKYVVGLVGK